MITLNDKIRGAVYGMALGDAMGFGTEFMTRAEVQTNYPQRLTSFKQFIRDAHRAQFRPGEWTNDTETMLRLFDSLTTVGHIELLDMSRRLQEWFDADPVDVVYVYRLVMSDPDWMLHPIEVAHEVWRANGLYEASNESMGRALIAALASSPENLLDDVRRLVYMTHDDRRCVASAAIVARVMQHQLADGTDPDFAELEKMARDIDDRILSFLQIAHNGRIEDLELDDEDTSWYTRKCMGVALWSHWHCSSPEEVLDMVVNEGGDADTNASLAMILAGIKYGFDALPEVWKEMHDLDRLEEVSNKLIALYGNK